MTMRLGKRGFGQGAALVLEALEGRRLLAGNVIAALDSTGALIIQGDNKSNQIEVETIPAGPVIVIGLAGTTINGSTSVASFFPAPELIRANMGNGDDSVQLTNLRFFQFVTVITGNGNDSVSVGGGFGTTSPRDLTIDMGNGSDDVHLVNATVLGDLNISTGNGPDTIRIGGASVSGDCTLDGGNGPDSLSGRSFLFAFGSLTLIDIETIS